MNNKIELGEESLAVIKEALDKLEGIAEGFGPFYPGLHRFMRTQLEAIHRSIPTEIRTGDVRAAPSEVNDFIIQTGEPEKPKEIVKKELKKPLGFISGVEETDFNNYLKERITTKIPKNGFTEKSQPLHIIKKQEIKKGKMQRKAEKEDRWLEVYAEALQEKKHIDSEI